MKFDVLIVVPGVLPDPLLYLGDWRDVARSFVMMAIEQSLRSLVCGGVNFAKE